MRNTLIAIFCILSITINAQEHHHSRNEIGISPGITYSPSHQNWGFGIHAHYFRTLSNHSPWSLGASVEQVYSHGSHWTVSAGAKYQLLDKLNIALMPGVTILKHSQEEEHEHGSKTQFSMHIEVSYDLIHLKHFHLGPAIDYSWSKHDTHFMLGVHCAYGF